MIRNTRQAICEALAHAYMGATNTANFQDYGCPIDRSSGNQAYLMAIQVQFAKIRAAVSAQREPVKNWLLYCLGPDVESMHKPDKQAFLAATVTQEAFSGEKWAKMPRLSKIAHLAVLDSRIGQLMGKELPVETYIEETGYNSSQWARDMEPYRRKALMVLQSYDKEGIGNVSVVVREIREAEEES